MEATTYPFVLGESFKTMLKLEPPLPSYHAFTYPAAIPLALNLPRDAAFKDGVCKVTAQQPGGGQIELQGANTSNPYHRCFVLFDPVRKVYVLEHVSTTTTLAMPEARGLALPSGGVAGAPAPSAPMKRKRSLNNPDYAASDSDDDVPTPPPRRPQLPTQPLAASSDEESSSGSESSDSDAEPEPVSVAISHAQRKANAEAMAAQAAAAKLKQQVAAPPPAKSAVQTKGKTKAAPAPAPAPAPAASTEPLVVEAFLPSSASEGEDSDIEDWLAVEIKGSA